VAVSQVVDGTGQPLAEVLRALVITACQPKMTQQLTHENSDVKADVPASPGAGARSIPR
jgi:hypothetical protein